MICVFAFLRGLAEELDDVLGVRLGWFTLHGRGLQGIP